MLKKILALGMVIGMVNAVESTGQVSFSSWDFEGRQLVTRITQSQTFPDKSTIDKLKSKLPTLCGGAYSIYTHLMESWSTGDEVWDYVPDKLGQLAEKIYSALLNS